MPDEPVATNIDAGQAARRIADECIGLRSRKLSRVVSHVYSMAIQPHVVTNPQVGLLAAIELAGPVHPSRLSKILASEKSTVSRNVRILIDKGWVLESDADIEPGKLLELTTAGRALLVKVYPAWEKAQKRALELVGADAPAALDRMFGNIGDR